MSTLYEAIDKLKEYTVNEATIVSSPEIERIQLFYDKDTIMVDVPLLAIKNFNVFYCDDNEAVYATNRDDNKIVGYLCFDLEFVKNIENDIDLITVYFSDGSEDRYIIDFSPKPQKIDYETHIILFMGKKI